MHVYPIYVPCTHWGRLPRYSEVTRDCRQFAPNVNLRRVPHLGCKKILRAHKNLLVHCVWYQTLLGHFYQPAHLLRQAHLRKFALPAGFATGNG